MQIAPESRSKGLLPFILAFLIALLLFIAVATKAQTTQGGGSCTHPLWSAECNPITNRCNASSPTSGCESTGDACYQCGMGLLRTGPPSKEPDPSIAFWGKLNPDGTMTISEPGPLARFGITKGAVLQSINGWRIRRHRLHNLTHRTHAAMLMKFKGMEPFWARL